jgi:predicted PurR-regulated permease PerM
MWLAVWLSVILVGILALRQILEPRIMGNSLGVSAFTMLALMVLSTSIFGVAGLILSPILTVLIKALYDQGYFKKWIRLPKEEFEEMDDEQKLPAVEQD